MKLKIYQQGGGLIYTPFIPEQYTGASATSTKSSGSDEDSKIDPLDKELLGLMKDQNLLPSDIQIIFDKMIAFQRRTQNLSSSLLGGTNSYRSVMPGMLQIMSYLSQAKYSKSADEKIVNQMMNENAGNEYALDGYGRMYVQTEDGKITKINPSSFDSKKHIPLSNSQLLYLRENSSELALNNEVFEDMRNMVGISSVSKEIDRIIKAFGTEEGQRYLSKETAQVFSDLNNPDGAYKLTMKMPSSGLKQAWKTIYDQLPTNMQNLLKIRAAVSGDTPETYISDIVFHNINTTQNIDYDASLSKAAGFNTGTGSDGESKSLKEDNYQIRFANGEGKEVQFSLVPTASSIKDKSGLFVQALDFGPMLNWDQLPLGQMNLQSALFGSTKKSLALNTSVRVNDVTFGNRLMDYSELPAIMYNNDSLTTKVYLPYRNENGHFVPDFKKIEDFNNYKKAVSGKTLSTTERNALLQKYNLLASDIKISDDGKTIELSDTMPFLSFSAYVGDDTIKLTEDQKRYLAKVDRSKGRTLKDGYNKVLKYNDVYAKKKDAVINKGFHEATSGDFWEGIVFIPCPDAFYAYNSTKNQYLHPDEFNDIAAKVAINDYQNQLMAAARSNPNYNDYSKIGQW